MAILYRTDGAWGSGKGVNLVPAEVDENFYDVDQRIEYLQDNPPEAVVPIAINIAGGLFTMQMSDGSTLGPIVMTMPVPQWRGDWAPTTPYLEMDFFVAPDGGMGAVMLSHTSAATFDWAALVGGVPVYKQMTGASGTSSGLSDLIDVAISGSTDSDFLVFNLAAGLWQNKTKAVVATTVLPAFGGDSGSGGTQGMVPAPASGDAAGGKVLGAGGAWIVPAVPAGSGTVTSVATAGGITGGPITTTGTIQLASIATLNLLANLTGGSAAPTAATLSAILDAVIGTGRGSLLRRGAGIWSALPPGTAGQYLKTGGAGADPSWDTPAGGGASLPSGTADDQLVYVSGAWTAQRPRYIVSCFVPGVPTASQLLMLQRLSKGITIPANFGSYLGHASMARGTVNATASTAIDVQKATSASPGSFSSVGTITIASAAMVGTFTSVGGTAITFAQGDSIALVAPGTPDATFRDVAVSLVAYET